MTSIEDLNTNSEIHWCPGCGNFGILNALKRSISSLDLNPKDVVVVAGIGCSGKLPNYINTYGFASIHGRALPTASGVQLSNPNLKVIAVGGDGDGYGIGLSHFIHSVRRNINITYIVHNNLVYGLTKGQTSPTSLKGFKTKSTPHGVIEYPINPLTLALGSNATFVARGYSGKLDHLAELIKAGIQHKGFSLIDVLQPCVSFNNVQTYDYYNKRVYDLQEQGYKPNDFEKACEKALEWGDKIPIGLFYKEDRPTYSDELPQDKIPIALQSIDNIDVNHLIEEYY